MVDAASDPMHELEEAMAVFVAWKASGAAEPAADLLRRHERLRPLLAPLLDARASDAQGASARRLGDFELVREIGRGGMGVVYEAIQLSLGRRVALKVLPAHLTLRPSTIARFQREASLAAKLRHPGIVPIHAVGAAGDAHFYAMELVHGAPLDRVIARLAAVPRAELSGASVGEAVRKEIVTGALPDAETGPAFARGYVETVVGLIARVADALQHAHAAGIVHRDIKPSNLLVRADGSVVVADFGLALAEDLPSMTLTGDFAGTPFYVSPEQAMSKRVKVDHRSDLFSLGAVLYELIARRRAFDGETTQAVLGRILAKDPPDPARLAPDLSPDLAAITLMALEKDPDQRYASAGAMAADLRAFLEYRSVAARRASWARRARQLARREPLKVALAATLTLAIPAVAGLSVYMATKAGAIHAGEHTLLARRIDSLLTDGFGAWNLRDDRGARACFEQILALDPACIEAKAGLAMLLSGEQNRAAALEQLADPSSPVGLFVAGLREPMTPRNESKRRAYDLFARATLAAPAPRLVYHGMLGRAASDTGDTESARRVADVIAHVWPGDLRADYFAAQVIMRSDPERAARIFERALATSPRPGLVRASLAAAQYNLRRFKDAARAAKLAIAEEPKHAFGYTILGLALDELDRDDDAIAALQTACALEPRENHARVNLGDLLYGKQRFAEAIAAYTEVRALDPAHQGATCNLGAALLGAGRIAEAERLLVEGVRAYPSHLNMHRNLVSVFRHKADHHAAEIEQLRWCALCPDDADNWHALAHTRDDLGKREDAIAAAERALQLFAESTPEHDKQRAEIRACLAKFKVGK